jgi:hypothetical protein
MLAGMEAAGFIREGSLGEPFGMPMLTWLHGMGFPKSLNVSKDLTKKGLRCACGESSAPEVSGGPWPVCTTCGKPVVPDGLGTALKPAWEPIITLRKPGPMPEGLPPLLIPFLYCAKVTKSEADAGIDKRLVGLGLSDLERNTHPTRKPVALMKWLVRAAARSGDTVLDPFCGSGSTGVAVIGVGCNFLGIERDPAYHRIAEARIKQALDTSMAGARSSFEILMDMDD